MGGCWKWSNGRRENELGALEIDLCANGVLSASDLVWLVWLLSYRGSIFEHCIYFLACRQINHFS